MGMSGTTAFSKSASIQPVCVGPGATQFTVMPYFAERHSEMVKVFDERAEKKEELIKTAKRLLANSEFTDEEIEKVKALRNEYKAIGFAGKEKDDDLYQRFNEVIQKYFEEMKFYKD